MPAALLLTHKRRLSRSASIHVSKLGSGPGVMMGDEHHHCWTFEEIEEQRRWTTEEDARIASLVEHRTWHQTA